MIKLPFLIGMDDLSLAGGFFSSLNSFQSYVVDLLDEAKENEIDISHETFRRNVEGLNDWAKQYGYAVGNEKGLHLKNDYHVHYARSTFNGRPCFILKWSGYEFIWSDTQLRDVAA